ncbi:MAG: HAD-IIIA family hydrolase [Candidatus Micrarchaeota archaeon]|nr:HAD-IIIA family hydrolase [Candidatus Micrarchaeota archaeon]
MPLGIILAGGLGTRLRPLTYKVPKPLVKVNQTPFISFVLQKLALVGIKKCLLLTGYKHWMIKKYCKDGKKWGLKISYLREKSPLGTGGAVLAARKKIKETALVLNGDSFIDFELAPFLAFHKKMKSQATIFALWGSLAARGSLKIERTGQVKSFDEKKADGAGYFNSGAYLIEPSALSFLEKNIKKKSFSMEEEGFPLLAKKGKLFAYRGTGRFLDIGTFESLAKAAKTVSAHRIAEAAKKAGGAAIFLDRDGVINRHRHDYVKTPAEFEFERGAIEGLKTLSSLGLPLFIVTNQSMVGRGIATKEMLEQIHGKMLSELRLFGVEVADVLICPHRPEENCSCRKPKIGMLLDAKERFGLELKKCFVIGDSTADIAMGKKAGCTTILVSTGYGGKDGLYNATADFVCENLNEAAKIVKKALR